MTVVAIGCETGTYVEAGFATRNEVKNCRATDGSGNLSHDVWKHVFSKKTAGGAETDSHGWIKMCSGKKAHCVSHRQYRKAESKRNAEQTDTDPGKRRRQHRASATAQNQPERPQEFRCQLL